MEFINNKTSQSEKTEKEVDEAEKDLEKEDSKKIDKEKNINKIGKNERERSPFKYFFSRKK